MTDEVSLDGRVAIVTGAGTGTWPGRGTGARRRAAPASS